MASSSKGKGKQRQQQEEVKPSAEFEVILDELQETYIEVMASIPKALKRILKRQARRNSKGVSFFAKANGKLYTPVNPAGTFLVKIKPTRECPPEDVLSLLYRWSDLYFEAFHSVGIWYRLEDAEEKLPPQSQLRYPMKKGIVNLPIFTSYPSLGGQVTAVGHGAFQKLYNTLKKAAEIVRNKEYIKFKKGPFTLASVAFSEALRFADLQVWVVDCLGQGGFGKKLPKEYPSHFNNWSDDSKLMFLPQPPADITQRLGIIKTSDGVKIPERDPQDEPETSSSEDD